MQLATRDRVRIVARPRTGSAWRRSRAAIAGALLCATSATASADWLYEARVGGIYDSNLTGAAKKVDVRPDWAVAVDASIGQFFALSGNDGLTLLVTLRGELYDTYHGLNLGAVGATARYRHKLGLGRDAPSVSLVVNGLYGDYRTAVRDGPRFDVRAEWEQRLGESIDFLAGIAYDRRYGPKGVAIVPGFSGEVFSLAGRSAYVRLGYTADDYWLLSVNGAVRRGDVESTSQQGLPVFLASTAIADDPAFNDPNLYAYRLPGTTWTLGATASYAFNDRSSLNVQYAYAYTNSPQSLVYRSNVVGFIFAHRF